MFVLVAAEWSIKSLLIWLKLILMCSVKRHREIRNEITWFLYSASVLWEKQSHWKILARLKARSVWQLVFLLAVAVPLECHLLNDQTPASVGNSIPAALLCAAGLPVSSQLLEKEMMSEFPLYFTCFQWKLRNISVPNYFLCHSKSDKGPYHNTARLLPAKSTAP